MLPLKKDLKFWLYLWVVKANVEFNLEDEADVLALKTLLRYGEYRSFVFDVREMLRRELKYGDAKRSSSDVLECLYRQVCELSSDLIE